MPERWAAVWKIAVSTPPSRQSVMVVGASSGRNPSQGIVNVALEQKWAANA